MEEMVEEVIAAVESQSEVAVLEQRLAAAESAIAELRAAAAASAASGRKTMEASAGGALLIKQGVAMDGGIAAGSLDAALESLSIEQRIAVKSRLMRAGLVG